MEISKTTYDKLVDMVNLFMRAPTYELEGKFKGELAKDGFSRCIQYCKSLKMAETVHDEVLDALVRYDDVYRVSFKGKNAIAALYKTNRVPEDFETVDTMKKTIVKGVKPILIDDISFKVDLKDEQAVDDKTRAELALKFPSLDKGYRFKKRYSYSDVKNGLRFDFSIVRTSKMIGNEFIGHKSFATSGTLQGSDRYEIEIEVIRDELKRTKPNIAKALVTSMIAMYLQVIDEKHFMSSEAKGDVTKEYLKLCYGKSSQQSLGAIIKKAIYRPKDYFIGPQPVTLELKNVVEPGLGIVSIVNDYTVTEKADGERCLLYVASDGKCYIINNRLSVKYTGVKINRNTNCVFDGEYITRDTLGRRIAMFGIFDAYYNNGVDVRGYPLVSSTGESRLKVMQNFAKQYKDVFASDGLTLFAKEFKYDGDIFNLAKELWDKEQGGIYPYKIDGLIFTPKNLAVGGRFLKDEPANIRTWDMVFKWKPPQENTIDFLIRFEKDDKGEQYLVLKENKYYKMATLYVGYNPTLHERLTAMKFLTNDVKQAQNYIPKEFIPGDVVDSTVSKAYLEIDQTSTNLVKVYPKCKNGDQIEDNSIVEFAYEQDETVSEYPLRWKPLRVRHDKTEMLRKFGLSHTANDYTTAMNVWSSIHHPVTVDIISGQETVTPSDIPDEDVYFTSTLDRYKYASIIMKDFHNKYIKNRELIGRMPKGATLLDIACGKAGDLKKWKDAGFSKVLGIDVVRDNIENRTNGAYARTIEAQRKYGLDLSKMQLVYLTADASKKIDTSYIENMEDPDDKQIAKILWGLTRPVSIKQEQLHKYYNYTRDGFDVISCQFAIHYFFENEQILDNFIYNVDTHLKKGGYFIGTCLDGYLVKEKLRSLRKGKSIQGVKDDRVLWNIKKLYSNNTKIKLGEQIEIFMESIGKPIKEYLVDFNLLKSKLSEKGIEVLSAEECAAFGIDKSIESFKTTFSKITSGDVLNMSQQEKDYSFLNSWFIFRKY